MAGRYLVKHVSGYLDQNMKMVKKAHGLIIISFFIKPEINLLFVINFGFRLVDVIKTTHSRYRSEFQ